MRPMADLSPGSTFGGYRIERLLGSGGMGVVYEAGEPALDRRVALKLILPDSARNEDFLERFRHESRIAARVEHPNVIPVYAVGEEGGVPYIAMRYVPGLDLGRKIKALRRLEPGDAAGLVSQVAAGLDAIHAAGLIHRDVKPANVLLAGDEGREHAYITDFGLAKNVASSSELTRGGLVMGTLDYVAPEQIEQRAVDARADVYALGCVLYKALTGEVPFPREDGAAKMWAHVNEEPVPASETAGVPRAFDPVIARAMAKRPEHRYPSAGDFGRAVQAAATGRPVTEPERRVAQGAALTPSLMLENEEGSTADLARRYSDAEPTPRLGTEGTARRRWRPPVALVGALVGAAVGVAIFVIQRDSSAQPSAATRHLIAQADEICSESRGVYNRASAHAPQTTREAADQADRLAGISGQALAQMRRLRAPPDVAADWTAYLDLREVQVRRLQRAAAAARRDNVNAYQEQFRKIERGAVHRTEAAQAVGLTQCSRGS
jgi:hypothetical protein